MTAKELYGKAYFHFESKEVQKGVDLCSILLKDYPDSKEARWALNNFPIIWDKKNEKVYVDEKFTKFKVTSDKVLILLLNLIICIFIFYLADLFYLTPMTKESGRSPESFISYVWLVIFPICFLTGSLFVGLLYKARQKENVLTYIFMAPGFYLGVFFTIMVIPHLFNSVEIILVPAIWITSSYSGILLGRYLKKLIHRIQ